MSETKLNNDDYYCYAVDIDEEDTATYEQLQAKAVQESGRLSKEDEKRFEKQKQYMITFGGIIGGIFLMYGGYKLFRKLKSSVE